MDHKLSWNLHMHASSNKVLRRANAIRMLTHGKNTLKISLLIRIFKAMIRSAYDYGAAILTTIPKSRLDKLEQIQNQVLRSILGGFKSTPKVLLNIETGIYPVKDRWDLLTYNYHLRLNGKTYNPAYETIHQLTKQVSTWKTKSTPAIILHLRQLDPTENKLFRKPPSQTPDVEPLPPWKHFDIPSNFFPLAKKHARDSNDSNQLFNLLMSNQDPNSLEIYTDGSVCKKTKTASCAFHIPKKKVGEAWLLENFRNSFNAKLHAIRQALYHLNNYEVEAVTMFPVLVITISTILLLY
jgi:hypothetical protein